MVEVTSERDLEPGNAALAALPATVRTAPLVLAVDARDDDASGPDDPNSILHGAQAIGKAAMSAGRMDMSALAQYEKARDAMTKKQEQEARELAHLAEWNSARTVVGGVEMTNGEAQEARQHVIDNGAHYADWALQQGLIKADEKEAFIETMRRKKELEDRRGRGVMTPEEEREAAALDASRLGHATDAATGQAYRDRGLQNSINMRSNTANEALREKDAPAPIGGNIFQVYDASLIKPLIASPRPIDPKVKSTGLDL